MNRLPNYFALVWISLSILFLTTALPASARTTLRNIAPSPHFAPSGISKADLAAAIKMGAGDKGWKVVAESPGLIRARLDVRTHMALVTIGFDETNYWIDYQDSSNLDYTERDGFRLQNKKRVVVKGPRIHRNYHRWIENLARSIEIRTRALVGAR